jgi:hypothetical protein
MKFNTSKAHARQKNFSCGGELSFKEQPYNAALAANPFAERDE